VSANATAVRPRATRDSRKALAQVPEAFRALYRPARYKVLYGGRGAGKSHAVATYVLSRAVNKTVRVLCCRELQTALRDSVHKLLCDQITALRIGSHFEITQSSIRTRNGSEFIFEGLKHNVSRIKSLEGCDICWVEEAQTVSHTSWEVLIPTIRKEGSEIIVTMNPELATDASYVRFIADPPPGAVLMPCRLRGQQVLSAGAGRRDGVAAPARSRRVRACLARPLSAIFGGCDLRERVTGGRGGGPHCRRAIRSVGAGKLLL
jgi:Phage terminase large subunit